MSRLPIARREDVQRLLNEGYEVDIQYAHLLVHAVPYVNQSQQIAFGILACPYQDDIGPADHVVSFQRALPCNSLGQPLNVVADSNQQTLFDKFTVQHRFSNKPASVAGFPGDYYVKMVHYIELLNAQAKVLDPDVDARTGRFILSRAEDATFLYPDSWSARAGIVAISQKLTMSRIGLVGLGGTGGYILDQVAKTPVKEIHLFDGGDFKRHSAFRAPGAASVETLGRGLKKVEYFREMYSQMRNGIASHPYYIDEKNVEELTGLEFVFVSVDDGLSRGLICNYLKEAAIPFIDVGMGLEKVNESASLIGLCRVTVGTPGHYDHLASHLPIHDDRTEALYRSNIQVSDMNAMNAMLAVFRWKQHCGFYVDHDHAHNLSFSVAMQSIVREELRPIQS